MNYPGRVLGILALGLGDVGAMLALRPDVGALARDTAAPRDWVARAGPDGAAITLAGAGLWCVSLWLGVGLLAALATALPGGVGHNARSLARTLLPAALHRVIVGSAGLGVLLAPVAAGAATPTPIRFPVLTSAPVIPAPSWPTSPTLPAHPQVTRAVPAPSWPTSPRSAPDPPAARTARAPAGPSSGGGRVVVQPGGSLWSIAAASLGPAATPAQIAAAWPRWYAANRATIGPDPDLIRPAQRLQAPAGVSS